MRDPAASVRRLATSFGRRDVAPETKAGLVRDVFDSVAGRYDLMNDLMSLGVHRLWKDALVDWLAPRPGLRHLDSAGGTGDVAFRILDRVRSEGEVVVCDINPAMLEVGRDRAFDSNRIEGVAWAAGSAEDLPFPDKSFDSYTIAFGIRNCTRIDRVLAEARRVLKTGGRFLCLEFSAVTLPGLDRLYAVYSDAILPRLGGAVAGNREAYAYLVESIRNFPDQETFEALIAEAGLGRARHRDLSGGIAAVHSGWRL